ncbi:MAG: hypothetical protein MUF19_02145 [Candidatus Pacebacteria bacterium]|nr:hypothetical protein [Candidatus Paceibacterota bacterium]
MAIGVAFVLGSLLLAILMQFRMLPSRPIYRLALGALFSTGVGFMIPNIIYVDILVVFVLVMLRDAWRHRKRV